MPEIIMPRLSDTMEEGTLSVWLKQPGDTVESGEVIAEIETDKATMELESYDAGTLQQILVQEGQSVPIGTPIAIVGSGEVVPSAPSGQPQAEAAPAAAPAAPAESVEQARAQEPPDRVAAVGAGPSAGQETGQAAEPRAEGGKVKASPVARAMAREQGIDLADVQGTGPGGRVVRADVEGFVSKPPSGAGQPQAGSAAAPAAAAPTTAAAGADVEEVPLSNVRKVTARRLVESMQNAPHFYLTTVVRADELMRFRAELNERLAAAGGPKVSVNDLIVKGCATAIAANPAVNVSFAGDKMLRHKRINVGVAVAMESGLIVPVIKDTDRKTLTQVATETRALAGKARDGKLTPDEFTGGTFTVSNLGMYGVDHFTAVINPPEAAILAVGATSKQAVVNDAGELAVAQVMKMTMSIDHRALDGATAAQFLQQLKSLLEEPLLIVT